MQREATTRQTTARIGHSDTITNALLLCGVVAGPFYIVLGAIQLLIRPGFDVRYHMLSQMALGDWGWVQVANFALSGLLVVAAAVGIRRAIRSGRGSTWGPRLIAVYGLGLIAGAIFSADPAFGFPPGTPAGPPATMSTHSLLHFISGAVAFLSIIGACLVLARRFASLGERAWAIYSTCTGIFFLVAFVGTASGSGLVVFTLALWAAIALAWVWLTALSAKLID